MSTPTDLSTEVAAALECCRQNRFEEAEKICGAVLQADANHAEALHLLGTIALRQARFDLAVENLRRAVAANGGSATYLCDLGTALNARGDIQEAVQAYRQALAIDSDFGRAHFNLGNVYRAQNQLLEAVACYERAIAISPDHPQALSNLGAALMGLKRPDEAAARLGEAVAISPGSAELHNNLGMVLRSQGRLDEAVECFKLAIDRQPGYAPALFNLGDALAARSKFDEAADVLERLVEAEPDHADAFVRLGRVLERLGHGGRAIACFERALTIDPKSVKALTKLGWALLKQKKIDQSVAVFERALAIEPNSEEALTNLGCALRAGGCVGESIANFRRALEINPDYSAARSNLIFTLDLVDGVGVPEQQRERREWSERHRRSLVASISPHENTAEPERKLRLGYVSADFRNHSACFIFGPVIRNHDRSRFEVVCYSGGQAEDEMTWVLRETSDLWRTTLGVSDEKLAEQIRDDGIDILVDLSGYTTGSRLPVFARKPAPVQVSAWGHGNGTGLETMDYLFSGPLAIPDEARQLYAEEVIDLPSVICLEMPDGTPDVAPLPCLRSEHVTFGCLNRLEKLSDRALALWGRIMKTLPQARLLVKDRMLDPGQQSRIRLLRRLGSHGIEPHRVKLLGGTTRAAHLETFNAVDLALDPFPMNGGASTAEALWMGVPVVALLGSTLPGRSSASMLTLLGMEDWVGRTEDEYARVAVAMASDPPRLARLRAGLRERVARSYLGDARRYARAVEDVYRSVWRRWCKKRMSAPP